MTTNSMCELFLNSNGRVYEILKVQGFNSIDQEYYKNSWQKQRVALMHQINTDQFVVAQYVGETSWGYGSYYDTLSDAENKYNEVLQGYQV